MGIGMGLNDCPKMYQRSWSVDWSANVQLAEMYVLSIHAYRTFQSHRAQSYDAVQSTNYHFQSTIQKSTNPLIRIPYLIPFDFPFSLFPVPFFLFPFRLPRSTHVLVQAPTC